jgi:hypothetical protein
MRSALYPARTPKGNEATKKPLIGNDNKDYDLAVVKPSIFFGVGEPW